MLRTIYGKWGNSRMARAERQNPETRRASILEAAITVAKRDGYNRVTRDIVAEEASISSPLVATYFPRMHDLRMAIMLEAISKEIVEIIAEGLIIKDRNALKINEELRQKVMNYLLKLK